MSSQIQSALRKITIFNELSDEMLAQVAEQVGENRLSAGEVLFREGEKGDGLFFIRDGELEISRTEGSTKIVLAVLREGEYFGEMAILEDKPRTATVTAIRDSELFCLSRDDFVTLLEKQPSLALKLTGAISARLRLSMESGETVKTVPEPGAGAPQSRVFISYSRRDKEFVQRLDEAISARGVDTWVDWENIPMTADWWDEIVTGIRNADAFAFVISPDSVASKVCNDEIQTAIDNNKRLVPILYRDTEPGPPMHPKISAHNWVLMRSDEEIQTQLPGMLAIINTDLGWVREHTRLLQRAIEWDERGRNSSFLLRGEDLVEAEFWLANASVGKEPQPTQIQADFILASREATNRTQRRGRFIAIGVMAILAVATLVSLFLFRNANIAEEEALVNYRNAQTQEAIARENFEEANRQKQTAQAAEQEALSQQATAEARRVEAEEARREAEFAREEAENQAFLARSRELSAIPFSLIDSRLDQALLLGVEAFRFSDTLESRDALLTTWGHKPELEQFLWGHEAVVDNVVWSSTGELASSSEDFVIIWDLATGQPAQTLFADDWVLSLAWSPDGTQLLAGLADGTIVIWGPQSGEEVDSFHEHESGVGSLDFSREGLLASGSEDGTILVWNYRTGRVIWQLDSSDTGVEVVDWSPTGDLASLGDGIVRIWDLSGESPRYEELQDVVDNISVAWSPYGELATGSFQSVILWNTDTLQPVEFLEGHTIWVDDLDWSEDGRLVSGGTDNTVIVWDIDRGIPEKFLLGHSDWVFSVSWSPDGRLASGGFDETVIVWDLERRAGKTLEGHQDWVEGTAWSADGTLASGAADGWVIVWDSNGFPSHVLQHGDQVYSVAWSPDGRLASGGFDDEVIIWDLESRQPDQILQGHPADVIRLAWSPEGDLASVSEDGTIILWDLISEQPDQVLGIGRTGKHSLAWSMDGRLASTGTEGTVFVWDLETGTPAQVLQGHSGEVWDVSWSPDGRLASTGIDRTVIVWDLESGEPEQVLKGHANNVNAVDWSPDGRLASGGEDKLVIIWDLAAGKPAHILQGHSDLVKWVSWSPDGRYIASGSNDNTVMLWETDPESWVEDNCNRAGRNLILEEWEATFGGEPYRSTCPQWSPGN